GRTTLAFPPPPHPGLGPLGNPKIRSIFSVVVLLVFPAGLTLAPPHPTPSRLPPQKKKLWNFLKPV
ncbi:unnamed protein product, partial [Sphagnum jensenii]